MRFVAPVPRSAAAAAASLPCLLQPEERSGLAAEPRAQSANSSNNSTPPTPPTRDAAEKQLGRTRPQRQIMPRPARPFVDLLPKPNDEMPQEVQVRLARIASEIRNRIAKRGDRRDDASRSTSPTPRSTRCSKRLEKQTGNRVTDYREQFGQETADKKVTHSGKDQPFWAALDKILDGVQMSPYNDSGEANLAIIDRDQGVLRRGGGRAVYSGPLPHRSDRRLLAARHPLARPERPVGRFRNLLGTASAPDRPARSTPLI